MMVEPSVCRKLGSEPKLVETLVNKSHTSSEIALDSKENNRPEGNGNTYGLDVVYVKWEASKDYPGKFITKLRVVKGSSLADLRKLIEIHLGEDQNKQAVTFLMLGDPTGAPVVKDKEATVQANKLPICNNKLSGHLACLRPVRAIQQTHHLPFSSLENKLQQITLNSPSAYAKHTEGFSPKAAQNFSPVSYVTTGGMLR